MRTRTWITGLGLGLLLAGAFTGMHFTREVEAEAAAPDAGGKAVGNAKGGPAKGAPAKPRTIDQTALINARRLAPLALTDEEKAFARQAERLANHEVDLAFAEALRQAVDNPPELTEEGKALKEAKDDAEKAVEADEAMVARIQRQLKTAPEREQDVLEAQLEVVQAQLELHRDELEEATEALERIGGDPQARIRRLKAAHEEVERQSKVVEAASDEKAFHPASFIAKVRHLLAMRRKVSLLESAQGATQAKIDRLGTRRENFVAKAKASSEERMAAKERAKAVSRGRAASQEEAKEAAAELKRAASDQRRVASYARRIQDQRELGDVYGQWLGVARTQVRAALHGVMNGLLVVLLILTSAFLLIRLAWRQDERKVPDAEGKSSTGMVLRFAIRLVAAVAVIFVLVGLPSQTTTVLGLAGAGLTVALKDFIVAFFGWFILMGRNGIRVGDWVEIKGVGGEVVEVGLLRTVLLETGNWQDAGHPTGRRVAFVNSFAMEGHFFNFTTSGQWMWDELKVMVPPGEDPYPVIAGVQSLVSERTESQAREAEAEWQKATRRYKVQGFSATPGIQVVPTSQGIEVHVRYITRAFLRHDTRKSLYEAVVALLHHRA